MYNIILVHIGDIFYDYINDNIENLLSFKNENIHLLINKINYDKIKRFENDIKIYFIEDLEKDNNYRIFSDNTSLDKNFRNGFWKSCSERFYLLNIYINKYDLENVFHLENDVLTYFNMEEYLSIFENKYKIGIIMDNDDRCIPSFLYIKNKNFSNEMIKFFINNNLYKKNDMESLANFYIHNKSICDSLPIIPYNYKNLINLKQETSKFENCYSNNYDIFNSIFDGASIGQYLGGVDPRNIEGDTTGFINETTIFNSSNLEYRFEYDEKYQRNIPFAYYNNQRIKINNLHIHCKNLKKFIK